MSSPKPAWPTRPIWRGTAGHPACELKGDLEYLIGATTGGMNTKLHTISNANGRLLSFFMTAEEASDYAPSAALIDDMPKAQSLLGDRPSYSRRPHPPWYHGACRYSAKHPSGTAGRSSFDLCCTSEGCHFALVYCGV